MPMMTIWFGAADDPGLGCPAARDGELRPAGPRLVLLCIVPGDWRSTNLDSGQQCRIILTCDSPKN